MEKVFTFREPAFEIIKSYRDTNGQMYVEGMASTTSIDETEERMSPEAIAKMAARLVGKPLRDEHEKGWYDKLGEIVQADVIKDKDGKPALWIKAKLYDWSSKAKDLFKLLKDGVEKMGLSVAGKISPGGIVRQFAESVGKYIPTYIDVEPTEVSVTDHPANLDTFAYAVTKSLNNYEESNKQVVNVKSETTESQEKGVNTMDKKKLVTDKPISPDIVNFVKDYNPKMATDMGGELKKVEKASGDKVVEKTDKIDKADVKADAKDTTTTDSAADVTSAKKADETTTTKEPDVAVKDKAEKKDGKDEKDAENTTGTPDVKEAKKVEKGSTSSLDSILSELASTLDSLKTGLSSDSTSDSGSDDSGSTDDSGDTDTGTNTGVEGADKAVSAMEAAMKDLKMCLGKAVKQPADGTQSPSTVGNKKGKVFAEDADKEVASVDVGDKPAEDADRKVPLVKGKKELIPGSAYSTEKAVETLQRKMEELLEAKKTQDLLDKMQKSITDLAEKVDKIPNQRKGYAMVVEKKLNEGENNVEKTREEYKDPFEAGRKTNMYKKLMDDKEATWKEINVYLNSGILPNRYTKLDEKAELKKSILEDKKVSFKETQQFVNGGVLPEQYERR